MLSANLMRAFRYFLMLWWCALVSSGPAQSVRVWLTTDDQTQLLAPQASVAFTNSDGGTNCVLVDETRIYQQIEGFGAAFTDTTGYNLNEVAQPAARTNAMQALFTRNGNGIGLGFMRLPMGASDLARTQYSYDDQAAGVTDTNLVRFSIAHDLVDIVPLIRWARQLNPQMKLIANPWSPPGWMKSSGSMVGGVLLPSMFGPFANYFVKFVKAYQLQGIGIDYLGLQNEPLYMPTDYPGMAMDATTQTVVLRDYVLPALSANLLTNRVLIFDHNWDSSYFPDTVLMDATLAASTQVAGTAWHGYGGTPGVMLAMESQFSSKGNFETEHSGGAWVSDQIRADFEEIIQVMRSWGRCYLKWNLAGDENDGPHDGGCSDCTPLVTVNSTNGSVSFTLDYYTLGHFSRFILPGACRVYSANSVGIINAAFLNPDGSKVLVAFNDTGAAISFQVQWSGRSFAYTLPGFAGATFTWSGTPTGNVSLAATNAVAASSFSAVSGLQTETSSDTCGGYDLGYASGGSYAVYPQVNLGAGVGALSCRLASDGSGGSVDFHLDGVSGPLLGNVTIPITGGWQTWATQAGVAYGGSGVHDLYLVFNGSSGLGNLNWFQFGAPVTALPAPWWSGEVGAVDLAGGSSWSNGVFTLNGSGNDIWNDADAFHWAAQPVAGNYEIRARVVSVSDTDPWAKAGIMLRESTNAGAVNVAVVITASNGVACQVRATTGGASTSAVVGGVVAPCWLRLVRTPGNSFTGYYSTNGAVWNLISATAALPMSNGVWAALVVTAHNNTSNCAAVFDHVSVNQAPQLAAVSNQTVLAGVTVTVTNTASDPDVPSQTLAFRLLTAPAGATISTNTGRFTWRPLMAQALSTQTVAVVVNDDGVPIMSATQGFTITVNLPVRPGEGIPVVTNGQVGFLITGNAGPDYTIQISTNLNSWSSDVTSTPAALPWFWVDTNATGEAQRFYRVVLGP
jgi:glucosylceramidase